MDFVGRGVLLEVGSVGVRDVCVSCDVGVASNTQAASIDRAAMATARPSNEEALVRPKASLIHSTTGRFTYLNWYSLAAFWQVILSTTDLSRYHRSSLITLWE